MRKINDAYQIPNLDWAHVGTMAEGLSFREDAMVQWDVHRLEWWIMTQKYIQKLMLTK